MAATTAERDSARAKSDAPRASAPSEKPSHSSAPSEKPSHTRSAILPLGLATAALAGLLLWLGSGGNETPPESLPETSAELAPATPENPGTPELRALVPEAAPSAAEPALAPSPSAEETAAAGVASAAPSDAASAAVTASAAPTVAEAPTTEAPSTAPAPSGEATPSAAPVASAETAAPSDAPPASGTPSSGSLSDPVPSDEGLTSGPITTVYMAPDCAELYRRGKRIGRSGVRVMVPEGKKRTFEVVCPGHGTRKLTLDGSRKELMIGLRPK